jgi:hypothetical protein
MKEGKKKKLTDLGITELFGAKRGKKGWDNFYWGVIFREKDKTGKEIAVNGHINMEGEGMIWSRDTDKYKYGYNLDSIVELRLDYGLHKVSGVRSKIAKSDFHHN